MAEVSMSGLGWDIYASRAQSERSSGPGTGSPTPAHLTRTLYIPHHDESTSHVSVFDISTQYTESIKQRGIGSASYVVALGQMPKPQVNDTAATIEYNVEFKDAVENDAATLKLTSVSPASSAEPPVQANIAIGYAEDKAAIITLKRERGTAVEAPEDITVSMSISYPIPPTKFRKNAYVQPIVYVHPYCAFQIPGEGDTSLEWQIHPVLHGRLRYTLVRIPHVQGVDAAAPKVPSDKDIVAIYHHIGDTLSLPLPFSEGVFLLSTDMDPATKAIVVASLLGLLWQLRRLSKTGKGIAAGSKSSKKGRFGFIKGLLDRK